MIVAKVSSDGRRQKATKPGPDWITKKKGKLTVCRTKIQLFDVIFGT